MVNIKQLLPVFEQKMNLFAIRLKTSSEVINKGFTINSGAWANDSGFCVAFLSCARSPQEASIDLTIDVSSNEDTVSMEAGIFLSDGSLIQDFGLVHLSSGNIDELMPDLEKYFDQISTNELIVFSKFLKEQKNRTELQSSSSAGP